MTRFHSPLSDFPAYEPDEQKVIESEGFFLKNRRAEYSLPTSDDTPSRWPDLTGLCLSGGGIRSATLSLGLVQRLISEGCMRRIDYLSSVSGGGYFAACFSSLMNQPPRRFVQPADEKKAQAPGLDAGTSPFVRLMATDEKAATPDEAARPHSQQKAHSPAEELPKIDARHQIHHLRSKGNYLTANHFLFSRDIQRAVGAIFGGIIHNVLLFAAALSVFVSLHYIAFHALSNGAFFFDLNSHLAKEKGLLPAQLSKTEIAVAEIAKGFQQEFELFAERSLNSVAAFPFIFLGFAAVGGLIGLFSLGYIRRVVWHIRMETGGAQAGRRTLQSRAGANAEDYHEGRFLNRFNLAVILGGPALVAISWPIFLKLAWVRPTDYALIFTLPFALAGGSLLTLMVLLPFLSRPHQPRSIRSLKNALRGGALLASAVSVLMPIYILLLFSFSQLFTGLFKVGISSLSSLISLGVAYLALMSKQRNGSGIWSKWIENLKLPLLSVAVVLAILLGASATASALQTLVLTFPALPVARYFLGAGAFLLCIPGFFVNSNRISLHYFYRDRLAEAYLKTDGRIVRNEAEKQGKPLLTLRNDEALSLNEIGWLKLTGAAAQHARERVKSGASGYRLDLQSSAIWAPYARMPYPLMVASLNLYGSQELVRKQLKSAHFIFSPHYVGSTVTGFARSDTYRGGFTKLARAMTISGAAVHSRMGAQTNFAQAFLATVLNFRLGYWIENPWFYRNNCREKRLGSRAAAWSHRLAGWEVTPDRTISEVWMARFNPLKKFTFWPFYLFLEMTGAANARHRMVNVSDGGHTGDNLGLLPLLRRRCKYILVADFEEDPNFGFESFNHVVRMAHMEENIQIKIDLTPLIPEKKEADGGIGQSKACVARGIVEYPDGTQGTMIYVKSSLCPNPLPDPAPPGYETLPVNVFHYRRMNPDFPHEPTTDQYFDDAQFEAYRALGDHLGGFAAVQLSA